MNKFLFTAILCITMLFTNAQITELHIGDSVPEMEFNAMNYQSPRLKLSDFKGKNIILDFWSTWCSNCVEGFPKMDSLQAVFKDKLQIILINSHPNFLPKKLVEDFISNWKKRTGLSLHLPMIIEDSVAYYTFRYNGLPHYVWIGVDGRIKAITEQREVTKTNVARFVQRGDILIPEKQDFLADRLLDFGGKKTPVQDDSRHVLFRKGEIPGLRPIEDVRFFGSHENMGLNGYAIRNVPIARLYRLVLQHRGDSLHGFNLQYRIAVEVTNPRELYSYDRIFPWKEVKDEYHLSELALADLNYLSGCIGKFEMRTRQCVVFTDAETIPYKNESGFEQEGMYTTTMEELARIVESEQPNLGITVNESKYPGKVKVPLPALLSNPDELAGALAPYGIIMKRASRSVKMFVISDAKK